MDASCRGFFGCFGASGWWIFGFWRWDLGFRFLQGFARPGGGSGRLCIVPSGGTLRPPVGAAGCRVTSQVAAKRRLLADIARSPLPGKQRRPSVGLFCRAETAHNPV